MLKLTEGDAKRARRSTGAPKGSRYLARGASRDGHIWHGELTRGQFRHLTGKGLNCFRGHGYYQHLLRAAEEADARGQWKAARRHMRTARRRGWHPPWADDLQRTLAGNPLSEGGSENAEVAAVERAHALLQHQSWFEVAAKEHVQLRFQRAKREEQGLDWLVKALTPSQDDVIALGNWCPPSAGPVQRVRNFWARHRRVLSLSEELTSARCSQCRSVATKVSDGVPVGKGEGLPTPTLAHFHTHIAPHARGVARHAHGVAPHAPGAPAPGGGAHTPWSRSRTVTSALACHLHRHCPCLRPPAPTHPHRVPPCLASAAHASTIAHRWTIRILSEYSSPEKSATLQGSGSSASMTDRRHRTSAITSPPSSIGQAGSLRRQDAQPAAVASGETGTPARTWPT